MLGIAAIFCLATSTLFAASPKLTHLYPAGVQKGKTAEVVAGGIDVWPTKIWVDDKRIEIKPAKERGKLNFTVPAELVAGIYWMRLFNDDGASPLRPFIVGSLPEINEVEPNDDPKKPQVLSDASVVVNGQLGAAGDVDHFAVTLKKGQTFVASMTANEILGSPMDAVLQIVSSDGFVLAENHDTHGLDPQIVFSVPSDGTYLVRAFAFPSQPDASIRFAGGPTYIYRLTLTTGGFADFALPLAIPVKEQTGVEMIGWNIPDAAKKIAVKPDRLTDHYWLEHPGVANPISLRIEPHRCIAKLETKERAARVIEVPTTITGRLGQAAASDVFEWTGKKNQKLTFQVEARSLGSALDPFLRLTDAEGKTKIEVDDSGQNADPEFGFAMPADGRYRIEIRDLYRHGGARYFYRLRILTQQPDFSLAVAAEPVPAVESVEIPVNINRVDGFAGPIEFKVEGLPENLTAKIEPPKAADATVKTVKVKITASKGGFSGPIKIVGVASSLAEPARLAQAPITSFKDKSEHIWVAITPKKDKK
jgi:hypothetical protein